MAERVPAAVALREAERKEIENQIKEFLERGGRIEQVPLHATTVKPVGPANYSGGLEGL